jgi:hypothetical protein
MGHCNVLKDLPESAQTQFMQRSNRIRAFHFPTGKRARFERDRQRPTDPL